MVFHWVVSEQGGLLMRVVFEGWFLVRMVSEKGGLSSLTRVVSQQGGLSLGRSLNGVVSRQGGLLGGWSLSRIIYIHVVSVQVGL